MLNVLKEAWEEHKRFNEQMGVMEKIMTRTFSPAIESLEESIERNSGDIELCDQSLTTWEVRRDDAIRRLNQDIINTKSKFIIEMEDTKRRKEHLLEANKILQETIDMLGEK